MKHLLVLICSVAVRRNKQIFNSFEFVIFPTYLTIDPVLLNSVAGSESALLCVGGGGGVDCSEEVERWDCGVEHIFRTLLRNPSNTWMKIKH